MKLWQIALVSVSAGVALPAIAQMNWGPQTRADVEARVKDRLGKFDANKDGTVSPDEMKAYAETRMKARNDERFAALDTDKNGAISRAEFDAGHMLHRGGGELVAMMHRHGGDAMMAPPHGAKGEPRRRMRVMMMGDGPGAMAWSSDGKGIVIADAVKKALERFDASDTNKDGTLSPEERKASREAWRVKMRQMVPAAPPAPPAPPRAG